MCLVIGRNLEEDAMSETSGHFRRLLVSVINANRDESQTVDLDKAQHDAKEIFEVCWLFVNCRVYPGLTKTIYVLNWLGCVPTRPLSRRWWWWWCVPTDISNHFIMEFWLAMCNLLTYLIPKAKYITICIQNADIYCAGIYYLYVI